PGSGWSRQGGGLGWHWRSAASQTTGNEEITPSTDTTSRTASTEQETCDGETWWGSASRKATNGLATAARFPSPVSLLWPTASLSVLATGPRANRHSCRCGMSGSCDAAALALLPNHCLGPAFSKDQVVVVVLAAVRLQAPGGATRNWE